MNLQQLRYIQEVARRGLNISDAAAGLYTSQPGVSRQIRLLEDELGFIIFERSGKRLTGITEPGRAVLDIAARVLEELKNLKRVGENYASDANGTLDIATTHTQARYALPAVIQRFISLYPAVRLRLHQGSPVQVADWVSSGDADLGIATESLEQCAGLMTLPCYQWSHVVIAPEGHPVLDAGIPTLASLAQYPLITYDPSFTGRSRIDEAFAQAGIKANIVLTAIDADVIKTYVKLGLGLGIIAEMAFDAERDKELSVFSAQGLFARSTTRLAFRRDVYLRKFDYAFIELLAPQLTRKVVQAALKGSGDSGDDVGL